MTIIYKTIIKINLLLSCKFVSVYAAILIAYFHLMQKILQININHKVSFNTKITKNKYNIILHNMYIITCNTFMLEYVIKLKAKYYFIYLVN